MINIKDIFRQRHNFGLRRVQTAAAARVSAGTVSHVLLTVHRWRGYPGRCWTISTMTLCGRGSIRHRCGTAGMCNPTGMRSSRRTSGTTSSHYLRTLGGEASGFSSRSGRTANYGSNATTTRCPTDIRTATLRRTYCRPSQRERAQPVRRRARPHARPSQDGA